MVSGMKTCADVNNGGKPLKLIFEISEYTQRVDDAGMILDLGVGIQHWSLCYDNEPTRAADVEPALCTTDFGVAMDVYIMIRFHLLLYDKVLIRTSDYVPQQCYNGAGSVLWEVSSEGYLEVSRKGYLKDAAELNCMVNDESLPGANVAILMA
ncbi:hypothetical protein Tco_0972792 [Tanacetum coccineum]